MTRLYSGIYKITNLVNEKVYIGSAVNIKNRWKGHMYLFLAGTNSRRLQRSWNKHGEKCFQFKVICYCKKEELLQKEQEMLEFYNSADPLFGYNIRDKAESNLGIKLTEKTKQKIRDNALRGDANPSKRKEVRDKISKANTGKIRSEETKEILSKATILYQQTYGHPSLGRHHSEETKELLSLIAKKRHTKGYHWSKEARKRVSKLRKGRVITPEWRLALSKAGKNRILSEETRQKLATSATKRWERFRLNKVA